MNLRRFFGLCTLAAIVFTVAVGESVSADNPTKKEIRLAQKKAAELKRAAEAKKAAEDAAKVAAAKPKPATPAGNPAFSKVAPPEPATPLKPAFIGAANDTTAVARFIDAQILKAFRLRHNLAFEAAYHRVVCRYCGIEILAHPANMPAHRRQTSIKLFT